MSTLPVGKLEQIQWQPPSRRRAPPLVLIHDSSGLAFNYFLLGDLGRDTFGVSDPLFGTDRSWNGGIKEIARVYVAAVLSTFGKGPIILGGWSLGGMIAIEMCHILRTKTEIDVLGLVLLDTPNCQQWDPSDPDAVDYEPSISTSVSQRVQASVTRRFQDADALVNNWIVPQTSSGRDGMEPNGKDYHHFRIPTEGDSSQNKRPSAMSTLSADGEFVKSLRLQRARNWLSPCLLVRAAERVPIPSAQKQGFVRVDQHRDSALIGWEQHHHSFVRVVQDTPGHHYNFFEEDISIITSAVRDWCLLMDSFVDSDHKT